MPALDGWHPDSAYDIGPHLTCSEADGLAELFRTVDRHDLADALIEGHTASDEEGDAHYQP